MNVETFDYDERHHCELIATLQTDRLTVQVLKIATKQGKIAHQKDINHLGQTILSPLLSSFLTKN